MTTVFDVFRLTEYQYLEIRQSTIAGDMITSEKTLRGVFKDKAGQVQNGNMESADSSATIHIKSSDFPGQDCSSLIGNGIRHNGVEYSIVGATAGMNYDTGELEHYRLTLQKANFMEMQDEG